MAKKSETQPPPPTKPTTPPPKTIAVQVYPARCPTCGSTERNPYHHIEFQDFAGLTTDGYEYNRIKRQRTECAACGQCRVEMVYEQISPAT